MSTSHARSVALGLTALTALGAAAGVRGFLSGSYEPMVALLADATAGRRWLAVDSPVVPAVALAAAVGIPQATALVLEVAGHRRAPQATAAAGAVLTVWVAAQYPLIGWGTPLQPAFAAVGLAEVATGAVRPAG